MKQTRLGETAPDAPVTTVDAGTILTGDEMAAAVKSVLPAAPRVEYDPIPSVLEPGGDLTIPQLKLAPVWGLWSGPAKKFIGTDGEQARADNLAPLAEVSEILMWMVSDDFPPHFSVALSLSASSCISIVLLNCHDTDRGPEEGAWHWLTSLDSYTEACHPSLYGTSLRVLCRGKLPTHYKLPSPVQIQTNGFVTTTLERVPSKPAFMYAHWDALRPPPTPQTDHGIIRDITEFLKSLAVPEPRYLDTVSSGNFF